LAGLLAILHNFVVEDREVKGKAKLDAAQAGAVQPGAATMPAPPASPVGSDEDLMNYEEQVRQETSKKMAMLEAAQRAILQKKQQAFASGELAQNQALAKELAQAERDVADKMRKAQEKASRNAMILGAAGSIIGAGIGSFAGPGGAIIGAQVGAGAGQVAAGKGAKAPGT
jgi:hypothetical protein